MSNHENQFGNADAYFGAFQAIMKRGIPEKHILLLRAHLNAPNHTATWSQLAEDVGYASGSGVNLQYGRLAARVAKRLGISEPPNGFWIFVLANWARGRDPDSGHTAFVLRRPVIEALTRVGILSEGERSAGTVRYWTCQWKYKFWRDDVNPEYEPVQGSGSNGFVSRGVSPGDFAYIIAVADGQLYLGGRMRIKGVDSRKEEIRDWGHGAVAPEWIIAEKNTGTRTNFHRRLAPELTKKLRLITADSEPKGYAFTSKTSLDSQTTRGVRELTPESAAILDRIIAITDRLPRSGRILTVTENLLRDAEGHKKIQFALPEEIVDSSGISEGSVQQILVNRYERDPRARTTCIEQYGTICDVCGFDFVVNYGDVMAGFIHVHHLKPLAAIGKAYKINPIRDLRPVCPNCHAVAHRREPPYSLDEVRGFIESR
jgi:hypothetical protein